MQFLTQFVPQLVECVDVADSLGEIIVQRQQVSLLETFERDRVAQDLAAQRFVDTLVILRKRHREPGRLPDAQSLDGILDRLQKSTLAKDEDRIYDRLLDVRPFLLDGVIDRDLVTIAW